jgi:hypothetical protein
MSVKAESLQDRFIAASLNAAVWQDTSEPNGTAYGTSISYSYGLITCATGASSGITSQDAFDLTDSAVSVELVDSNGGNQFFLVADTVSGDAVWLQCGGVVEAVYTGHSAIQSETYSSDLHRFLRIAEVDGTVHFDVSRDGVTWRSFASLADPMDMTSVQVACYSDGTALSDPQFANVGLVPAGLRVACSGISAR